MLMLLTQHASEPNPSMESIWRSLRFMIHCCKLHSVIVDIVYTVDQSQLVSRLAECIAQLLGRAGVANRQIYVAAVTIEVCHLREH